MRGDIKASLPSLKNIDKAVQRAISSEHVGAVNRPDLVVQTRPDPFRRRVQPFSASVIGKVNQPVSPMRFGDDVYVSEVRLAIPRRHGGNADNSVTLINRLIRNGV